MSYQKSFQDFKAEISFIAVLEELGYKLDKSKGRSVPSYVLLDANKKEMDRVYIFKPNDNANSNYFRRNPGPGRGRGGDVVGFIRENISSFPEYVGARNEVDAVNRVCYRFCGVLPSTDESQADKAYISRPVQPFSLEAFDRELGNWQKAMRFFKERGIEEHTAQLFKDNFELVRDTRSNKTAWHNLGFPYRRPGEPDIVGYEIRGFGTFKNKAEGTDSTSACWQAYLGTLGTPDNIPPLQITHIHMAESAYDMMSYVQLHRGRLDLDHSLFVSVGGTFSNTLVARLFQTYPSANAVLHFDNDVAGVMYDIRTAAILMGRTLRSTTVDNAVRFTLDDRTFDVPSDKLSYNQFILAAGLGPQDRPQLRIEKAPGEFKDWNEVLQTALKAEKTQQKYYRQPVKSGTLAKPAPNPEVTEPKGWHR